MTRPRGAHKPKSRKRPRRWHHGAREARRWDAIDLPDVASGADPTTGTPTRAKRDGAGRLRGDAL